MIRRVVRNKHFLLRYEYVEEMETRRTPFFSDHRAYVASHVEKGLKLAGPVGSPVSGAALLFESDRQVVEDFVASDPYFMNSLIVKHSIDEFEPIINKFTST